MVIKSICGNEGRVGTVIRWVAQGDVLDVPRVGRRIAGGSGWLVEGRFKSHRPGFEFDLSIFQDSWLMPLKGDGEQDEVESNVGKPEGVAA